MTTFAAFEPASVTIVVPCYNEEEGLHFLAQNLKSLNDGMGRDLPLSFVLVDDGSTDKTWDVMQTLFGGNPQFTCLRHTGNRGIAAASLTGISASRDEAVAVIDSDCSYDPSLIAEMVPLLAPDVSLVTASPYHDKGSVRGVPRWRLVLSHGASLGYRLVLHNKLATYTSCFRLYRRSAVVSLSLKHGGFEGVAEKLVQLDRQGWRIVEVPAVLNARQFGQSKLRIARVIRGHIGLMVEIVLARLLNKWSPLPEIPSPHTLENRR
jgi:glycosyltransferase involved in cell wall biosynthesis